MAGPGHRRDGGVSPVRLSPGTLLRTVPGTSLVHGAPLWLKYAALVALGIVGTLWRGWPVGCGLLVLTVLLYALAGRHVLAAWAAPLRWWWWLFLILGAYQWLISGPGAAVGLLASMFSLMQLARLLLLTTPTAQLMDGLGRAASVVGLPRSHAELVLALIVRTLPDLSASWARSREAAAARGLRRAPLRTATHLGVTAVARARDAGDALAARGLPEPTQRRSRRNLSP